MSIGTIAIGLDYPGLYSPPPAEPFVGPPVVIVTTALPTLLPEVPYLATLEAQDGKTPYRWGITSGTLPPGISLSSDGVFTGTAPNVATIEPDTLPIALVDQFYFQAVVVADHLYPITVRVVDAAGNVDEADFVLALWENPTAFSLIAGTLPGCVSFSGSGVGGPPMRVGTYPITVRATDIHGRTITHDYVFTVVS